MKWFSHKKIEFLRKMFKIHKVHYQSFFCFCWTNNLEFVDPWIYKNSDSKEYFSERHKNSSRINMICISKTLAINFYKVETLPDFFTSQSSDFNF